MHDAIAAGPPARLSASDHVFDTARYVGTYRRETETTEVMADATGTLRLRQTWTGALLDGEDPDELVDDYYLRTVERDLFPASVTPDGPGEPVRFAEIDGTRVLYFLMRASPLSPA
ncbi:hypothetical protein ACFQDE_22355 [Deinococcus caeni]|uniref:hypothetical protein n=1 Tax=Deinococcus caeni TaxID=569127 RepID=UPI0036145C29